MVIKHPNPATQAELHLSLLPLFPSSGLSTSGDDRPEFEQNSTCGLHTGRLTLKCCDLERVVSKAQLQVPPPEQVPAWRTCGFSRGGRQAEGRTAQESQGPPPPSRADGGVRSREGPALRLRPPSSSRSTTGLVSAACSESYFRPQPKSATANYTANNGEGARSARLGTPGRRREG